MRLAEADGPDPCRYRPQVKTLRVLGKRNKERIIPMADPLVDLLRAYLDERDRSLSGSRTGSAAAGAEFR